MSSSTTNQDFETELVADMNSRHAALLVGGKFRVLSEVKKPDGEIDITYSTCADIRNYYANRVILQESDGNGKPKIVNPFDVWHRHPERRQYHGVVFDPGKETPNFYNLWRGFQVEPKEGATGPYLDHVFYIICKGDPSLNTWVIDWISDCFKNIGGQLPGSALVTRGKKGAGKGLLVEPLQRILGAHFVPVTSEDDWLGQFNSHIAHAIIIYANEAFWAGRKSAEGKLKAIITERPILLNEKYVPAIQIVNHSRTIIASNESWVVPATTGERRFCVLDVSDERIGDTDYFNKMFKWCADPDNLAALLHFFQSRDITSNLRQPPITDGLAEQIELSMNSVGKFWLDCLDAGYIAGGENDNPDGFDGWVKSKDVYESYIQFCRDTGERFPESNTRMSVELRKVCEDIEAGRQYFFDGRHRGLKLPSLDYCRGDYNIKSGVARFKTEEIPF